MLAYQGWMHLLWRYRRNFLSTKKTFTLGEFEITFVEFKMTSVEFKITFEAEHKFWVRGRNWREQ